MQKLILADLWTTIRFCPLSIKTPVSVSYTHLFPIVDRDLAVIVDDKYTVGEIADCIKNSCALCESVALFDVYKGEQIESGYKSLAFSIDVYKRQRHGSGGAICVYTTATATPF